MTTEQIMTAIYVVGAIISALFIIDKVIDLIKKYKKPADDLHDIIETHSRLLENDNKRLNALEDNIKETNRIQNKALLQLMNHSIDGNHTEKLKEARDEMENYLIGH